MLVLLGQVKRQHRVKAIQGTAEVAPLISVRTRRIHFDRRRAQLQSGSCERVGHTHAAHGREERLELAHEERTKSG